MQNLLLKSLHKSLPEELEDYINSHYTPDRDQESPTVHCLYDLVFDDETYNGETVVYDPCLRYGALIQNIQGDLVWLGDKGVQIWPNREVDTFWIEVARRTTLTQQKLRNHIEQDEIVAMGAEDSRLCPNAELQVSHVAPPPAGFKWTKVKDKWIPSP